MLEEAMHLATTVQSANGPSKVDAKNQNLLHLIS